MSKGKTYYTENQSLTYGTKYPFSKLHKVINHKLNKSERD